SLPGYGFSAQPTQAGVSARRIADLFATLMRDVLGYRRFGTQGGDWGASIAWSLARRYQELVLGIHLNLLPVQPRLGPDSPPVTEEERDALSSRERRLREHASIHGVLMSTRPQTLAYGLTDSPVAQAAWIVEWFRSWSDCDGDVERSFSKDQLLTNIMLYWV